MGTACALTLGLIVGDLASILWEAVVGLVGHIWTAEKHRIVSVSFDMLLQILRALERLAAEVAPMRLQRHVDANVRGNMVTLDDRDVAVGPSTFQVEIVRAFTTDVNFANMVLERISNVYNKVTTSVAYIEGFGALSPLAAARPETLEWIISCAIWGKIRSLLL